MEQDQKIDQFITNLVKNEIKEALSHHNLPSVMPVAVQRKRKQQQQQEEEEDIPDLYQSMTPILISNRLSWETNSFDFKKSNWTTKIAIVHACYMSLETYVSLNTEGIALCDCDPGTVPFLITLLNSFLLENIQQFHLKFMEKFNFYMKDIVWLPTVQAAIPKLEQQYQAVQRSLQKLAETAYTQLQSTLTAAMPKPVYTRAWLMEKPTFPLSCAVLETFKTHLQHLQRTWFSRLLKDIAHDIYWLYIEGFTTLDLKNPNEIQLFTVRLGRDLKQILAFLEGFDLGQTELVDIPVFLNKLLLASADDILELWLHFIHIHSMLNIQHLTALLSCRVDIPLKTRHAIIEQAKQ